MDFRSTFLLDDNVRLVAGTGEKTPGGLNMSSFVQRRKMEELAGAESTRSIIERMIQAKANGSLSFESEEEEEEEKGLVDWVREGSVRVTIDKPIHPLDVLTVSLHLPATPNEIHRHIEGVTVMGTNGQFVVLCTGPYLHGFASSGHYLVVDTTEDKLHLVPSIIRGEFREDFGRMPVVVMAAGAGAGASPFVLALVLFSRRTQRHSLLVYTAGSHWVQKEVSLPRDVVEYPFSTDVAFPIHGDLVCWVDLKLGMLLCDLHSDDPRATFVPLPEGYEMSSLDMSRGRPNVHCTVGFINGSIRLVYMDGYSDEECPRDQVTISTWTYNFISAQEGEWIRDHGTSPLRVAELWDAIPELPKRPPMCPILSASDPDAVFFFTSDIGYVDGHIATRGEHVLCLNMQSKTVRSWRKCPPRNSYLLIPSLVAIDLPVDPRFSDMDDQVTSQL